MVTCGSQSVCASLQWHLGPPSAVHTNAAHSGRLGRGRLRLTCGRGCAQHGGGFKDGGIVRGGALIRVVQRQAVGGQQEAGACGTAQQTQVTVNTLMCFLYAASQKTSRSRLHVAKAHTQGPQGLKGSQAWPQPCGAPSLAWLSEVLAE